MTAQEQVLPFTLCVLQRLFELGVRQFVVCAGARNASFVLILERAKGVKIYSHFEERSASFFALGLTQATCSPVAVITTSGTAVAECYSAVIEAHYSAWPLVIVSADRPASYRGSGAPQAIEQVGIFANYPLLSLDLQSASDLEKLRSLPKDGPTHLNICLEDPRGLSFTQEIEFKNATIQNENISHQQKTNFKSAPDLFKSPLVVVGGLKPAEQEFVFQKLQNFKGPLYLEHLSGLQGLLHSNVSEEQASELIQSQRVDSIVRIGGVPTIRLWRDLEDKASDLEAFNFTSNSFAGLARQQKVTNCQLHDLELNSSWTHEDLNQLSRKFALAKNELEKQLEEKPKSELALVRSLLKMIDGQPLYVGNSLPIREVDQLSFGLTFNKVAAQRGANGIDGQISGYLGWATQFQESWCLVGDLTALYDLQALWLTDQMPTTRLRIVIINNSGGKIFEKMFKNDFFLNRHNRSFSAWALMFGWGYSQVNCSSDFSNLKLKDLEIIEVIPEPSL
jgi:2-succinyl-5-enolpyruvyl-6-hydroxy-3-cyclohexene-1-carboxylate synthase